MDEIDAALVSEVPLGHFYLYLLCVFQDFKNVSIVANYIKDRTKNAQFIIISLRFVFLELLFGLFVHIGLIRNNMFELADRLVGIYKTQDATKSVSINPKMFEKATNGEKNEFSVLAK
jgi:hypothetical protein